MTIIKEIKDTTNIEHDINKDMASYVVISHHLLSFVKVGGNHTLFPITCFNHYITIRE